MAPTPLLALPHADHDRARVEAELLEAVRAPTEAMTEMAPASYTPMTLATLSSQYLSYARRSFTTHTPTVRG